MRNGTYINDSDLGIVRRVDDRNCLRRRSSSLPPPIFPQTPKYVSQTAQLPQAQVAVEKISAKMIGQVFEHLENRRRLVEIINLPSRNREYFHLPAQFFNVIDKR